MKLKWSIPLIALLALALCCALVAVSFAEKCDQDQKLTIEQLPAAVRATLQAQAQGNPIEDIEKETEDGVTFYSADIVQGDKKVGVEIAENGQLLNSEPEEIKSEEEEANGEENEAAEADEAQGEQNEAGEENEVIVPFDQLPAAVQATLQAEAGSGTIDKVEQKTENGADVFSADVTKNGQEFDVTVAANGQLISSEPEKSKGCKKECGDKEEEDGDSD